MEWFYETPIWITLPLFTIGFVAISCGIVLALVAVSVYENFAYARTTAVDEAGEVGTLYRATTLLDESNGDALRATIDDYMHAVIELDWPQQERGILPDASDAQVDEMEGHLKNITAEPGDEQAVLQQVLETFDTFIETRRARIDATALALPPLLWLVIWVGAFVNVVLLAFIDVQSRRLHLLMVGLLSLFIGLVIFVTADMDHPYAGAISVGPGAYERVLIQVIDSED